MAFWVTKSEHVGSRYFIFAEVDGVVVEKRVDISNSLISSKYYLTTEEKLWFRENVLKTVKNRYHINSTEFKRMKDAS